MYIYTQISPHWHQRICGLAVCASVGVNSWKVIQQWDKELGWGQYIVCIILPRLCAMVTYCWIQSTHIKDIAKRPLLGGKEGNFKQLILEQEKRLQFLVQFWHIKFLSPCAWSFPWIMSSSCIKNLLQEVEGEGRHNLHRSEVTDNYWKPGRRRSMIPVTYKFGVKIR